MKIQKSGEGVVWWRARDTRATCQDMANCEQIEATKNLPTFQDLSGSFKLNENFKRLLMSYKFKKTLNSKR